ncbi:MAG: type II toxin-antitoxin system mRNA interferase toxin, RelE/StbE family [bacterium]|nr:type II toxin-antitoxin system mRNA interferase toxin, RelE/StbE family [bacterium]MDP3381646.1 type II toxin-antitoxin system mRNA interferase toxin, RelE/StbE family [bacterium]
MRVNNILFDAYFEKTFQKYKSKLTEKQKENLKNKLIIFKNDAFDESLKTHKLSGNLKDYYSFRITYKDRIKFKLLEN